MGLRITSRIEIEDGDLTFEFSRGSGPGGQNVNKVSTRATLCFDLASSTALTARQKHMVRSKLSSRISQAGVLRVTSRRHRTQPANQRAARERFVELMADALTPPRPRVATRPSRGVKERRIREKKRRGDVKKNRRPPTSD